MYIYITAKENLFLNFCTPLSGPVHVHYNVWKSVWFTENIKQTCIQCFY